MGTKLRITLVLFALSLSSISYAQDQQINGIVNGENNLPLPGANILVKGTSRGVQTDFNGNYTISASQKEVLVYSYVGYTTQEIIVTDKTDINVTLVLNAAELDEILVVGYGKSTKRNLTDNVASVSANDINNIPVPSVQSTLSGKASGVQVTQVNGKAESGIKVRVRGVATISSSQEPLYVVDGIPIINSDENINDSPINPLISLNPDDIASIEILKDASSAAIYGARGANGVILITTKAGIKGKFSVEYNGYAGVKILTNKVEMAQANLYTLYSNEAASAPVITSADITGNTVWMDEITRPAIIQNHNVSVSGGKTNYRYYFSGGYLNEQGVLEGNDYSRFTLRYNHELNVTSKLKFGNILAFSHYISNNKPFAP